jgi:hypothetical protein
MVLVSFVSEKLKALKANRPVGLCLMEADPAQSWTSRLKFLKLFGAGKGGFGPLASPPPPDW